MEIGMYALTVIRDVMHLMLNLYRFWPPAICNCILGSKREMCPATNATIAVTTKDLGNELTVCPKNSQRLLEKQTMVVVACNG